MTRIAIVPEPAEKGRVVYRAISGERQSCGKTAGEALDALTAQLPAEETGTLVVVQSQRPDRFFSLEQQRRLATLMQRWREARDNGDAFSAEEHAELNALVEAEVVAAGRRAAALLQELQP